MRLSSFNKTFSTLTTPSKETHVTDHVQSGATKTLRVLNDEALKLSNQYTPKKWHSIFKPIHQSRRIAAPVRLGSRWPDYQGARNWDGLLSPLDHNLRSEILRYGNFVEATYRAFDFEPSSPSYAACRFRKKHLLEDSGFPNTGYRLTKHLRATSGITMPRWTEKAASWAALKSSWIGYVAVCTDKAEIKRLGRRDVVIALRGTATCLEWAENFRATLTKIPGDGSDAGAGAVPMVESGFLSLYTSGTDTCPSLQDMLRSEICRILEIYKGEELSFTLTGHSLGAALAALAAYDIKMVLKAATPLVTVMSFGGPRVGNLSFRLQVEKQGTKILRIVNPNDLITKLPGFVIGESEEVAGGWSTSEWLQRRVEDTQWVYAEVGHELRLSAAGQDMQRSPYMVNMDFAKCHDLKTYLSLVRDSVGNNCPLRRTAKSLLRKGHPKPV